MNNSEEKHIMGVSQFKKTRLSPVSVVGFPFHHHCEETTNKTKSYNNDIFLHVFSEWRTAP